VTEFFDFTYSEGGLEPYGQALLGWRRFLKITRELSEAIGTLNGPGPHDIFLLFLKIGQRQSENLISKNETYKKVFLVSKN
jgi:hypothetical protein